MAHRINRQYTNEHTVDIKLFAKGLFIDVQKTFDSVNRDILVH